MGIPSKQIGWSQESNLLWQISSQMERLSNVVANSGVTSIIAGEGISVDHNTGDVEVEIDPRYTDSLQQSGAGTYNVFTALITQNGDGFNNFIDVYGDESIQEGVSYEIIDNPNDFDLSPYGADSSATGQWFLSNQNVTLPFDNSLVLRWNPKAPIAKVLINKIGNIWFERLDRGTYMAKSNSAFGDYPFHQITPNKSNAYFASRYDTASIISILTYRDDWTLMDNALNFTPYEIRVYN
jgi:hypothetical protein